MEPTYGVYEIVDGKLVRIGCVSAWNERDARAKALSMYPYYDMLLLDN